MRMKRFLSFVLAVVMLASLTISASAAKLYFELDFDKYNTINEFTDTLTEVATRSTNGALAHRASGLGNVTWGASNTEADFVTSDGFVRPSLTAINGTNWFTIISHEFTTLQNEKNSNGYLYAVTDEGWDYVNTPTETYIVSFDYMVNPLESLATSALSAQDNIGVIFAKADESASTTSKAFYVNRVDAFAGDQVDLSTYTGKYNSTIKTQTMANNTAYKLAVGYTYAEGKNIPQKAMAINGVVDSMIINDDATNATPEIRGLVWNYKWHVGSSFANLKMYAVENGGMTVSRIGTGDVATSTVAVPVKFSQPVYAPTFNPANVTVTVNGEPLAYGDDFTVSGVTEEVSGTGASAEVYSKATVTFCDNLEAASVYEITFPAAITNEIGTAIANRTVTFNTPSPDVVVGNKLITKAWGTDSAENVGAFVKNDGLYGASLDITNTTENNKAVAVIYAVYAGGKLKDVVYANDTIAAKATATIGAGVELSSDATAVKAFIWDGLTSLKPGTDASVWELR